VTIDDRERLSDIRGALHGIVMRAGQLDDQAVFEGLEERIDKVIAWIKSLDRKSFPKQGG